MSDPIIPWLCDVLQSYNPIIGREKDMLLACNRLRTSSQPNHWCFWTFFISVIFLCILFYILWHSFLLTCEVVWYTVLKSCSNDYLWKCTTVAIFIWTFFFPATILSWWQHLEPVPWRDNATSKRSRKMGVPWPQAIWSQKLEQLLTNCLRLDTTDAVYFK